MLVDKCARLGQGLRSNSLLVLSERYGAHRNGTPMTYGTY